jgi:magnesium-transporting ATPase (P-type)
MLAMIVTVNLGKGALAMSRRKVIVKRLNSIQNFGAMNVLCTDKTGTLTQGRAGGRSIRSPSSRRRRRSPGRPAGAGAANIAKKKSPARVGR